MPNNRLLWVDDDPEDRFLYERFVLEKEDGWEVHWAGSPSQAAEKLESTEYAGLVLDQMMPDDNSGIQEEFLWGGCRLLYWLRRTELPEPPPWPTPNPGWMQRTPLEANRKLPAVIVSAFHDEQVLLTTKKASPDNQDQDIQRLAKPLDLQRLRDLLGRPPRKQPQGGA